MAINATFKLSGITDCISTVNSTVYYQQAIGDVNFNPEHITADLAGNQAKIIDVLNKYTGKVTFEIPHFLFDFEFWGAIGGHPPVVTGAAPNEVLTLKRYAGECLDPFSLVLRSTCVGSITGIGIGNVPAQYEVKFYNVHIIENPTVITQNEFASCTAQCVAWTNATDNTFMEEVLRQAAI